MDGPKCDHVGPYESDSEASETENKWKPEQGLE